MTKRTKIVCTVGPASEKPAALERMIRAGMNVARLNMSHGSYVWHGRAIRTIRAAAKKVGEPVAVLIDLQGPKARIDELRVASYKLQVGDRVVFTTSPAVIPRSSATRNPVHKRTGSLAALGMASIKIPIAVPNFHKYVKKGSHLLIADGVIECVVERVAGRDIHARVILGGELKSHKGIAIQGVSLPLPSLTAKDRKDVAWARRQDIDFVALSFVKQAKDVEALRKLFTTPNPSSKRRGNKSISSPARGEVRRGGSTLQIIVKIETREAVANFDEILRAADGIMIARGDLALATSAEDVPILQKEIIEKCRRAAKPVIVATEMLASMERTLRPTRAEASDVANAVIDHTDAVMLSGESATGRFPVETVATMARIIEKTEKSRFDDLSIGGEITHGPREEEVALLAAVRARTEGAKAIAAGTLTGHTGRLLSRFRTEVPLLVGTPNLRVVRQLNLSWGVKPFFVRKVKSANRLTAELFAHVSRSGLKRGSKVILVSSSKISPHGQSRVEVRKL